ncbi:hypothetical protein SAMN05428642_1022 [Flaviramulus basaltis]|uniref:Uncharacterized protein n=1 Tax=Flaviramulus basaltis TaxID=369401 RepID=A0A1K2IGF3_9FLAO|nr:hypothetical protein [Flaviramulus basaltis]SFZ91328.1 hypothetical protein SAMN05428642_1022 [Flaviramulus basaltis]
MTINEFNILSFENKYEIATYKGLFLYNYVTKEEVYDCYSFDTFSVEIVYDDESAIIEIRSFENGEMINNFSGRIELM